MNVDVNGTVIEFPDDLSEGDLNKAVSSAASQMGGKTQPASTLSDVPSNAVKDVGGILGTVGRMGQGVLDLPRDVYQTGKQLYQGQSFPSTPIGQDLQTMGNAAIQSVPHLEIPNEPGLMNKVRGTRVEPGTIFRQYQDLAAQPLKMIPGKVGQGIQQAYPENPLVEHPVNSILALAPLAGPAVNAAREIPVVDQAMNKAGSVFRGGAENFGRRSLGLTKRFLGKNQEQLPQANEAAGVALDQGVIRNPLTHPFSSSAEDMLQRANALDVKTGKSIGSYTEAQPGSFDFNQVIKDLDQLKSRFHYDPDAISRIENAKDLIGNKALQFRGNIPFDEANQLKSYIQKKVPWQSDAASAEVGQQAAGTIRGGLDTQLENVAKLSNNMADFQGFKKAKKVFGSTQIMQKGLLNKTAAESGNLPISPYSVIAGGAEFLHGGNPVNAAIAALGTEWAKRYGSAASASILNNISKAFKSGVVPNVSPIAGAVPAVQKGVQISDEQARQFWKQAKEEGLKGKELRARAEELATQGGFKW